MKQTEILTHATHVNGWGPAVHMSCMSQNFRLFHVSNFSVRNFRIFLLMYTGSLMHLAERRRRRDATRDAAFRWFVALLGGDLRRDAGRPAAGVGFLGNRLDSAAAGGNYTARGVINSSDSRPKLTTQREKRRPAPREVTLAASQSA